MEVKSKFLLPRGDGAEEMEADPRLELVRQLVEYKRFKDAAALLEAQAERQLSRVSRLPVELPSEPNLAEQPLRHVELWDLVGAFGRLMRETLALQPQQIIVDQTPVHVHMESILERLRHEPQLPFSDIFTPPHHRSRLVGLFLAILELVRARRVSAEQPEEFGEIWLYAAEEPPEPPPSADAS